MLWEWRENPQQDYRASLREVQIPQREDGGCGDTESVLMSLALDTEEEVGRRTGNRLEFCTPKPESLSYNPGNLSFPAYRYFYDVLSCSRHRVAKYPRSSLCL